MQSESRHVCREEAAPKALHGSKGIFSFAKENAPFGTPRERLRLAVSGLNDFYASGMGRLAHGIAAVGVAIRFDSLLLSAVAQPLAALLPYGCGTPLAGAALESERKCSVITCCRWHNIAASAAKPPRQTIASLYKSKVGGNCVRLTNRRQSDSEDRSKPSRLDTKNSRHPIPQAAQLFELLACNANLSLGGSKGGYSLS